MRLNTFFETEEEAVKFAKDKVQNKLTFVKSYLMSTCHFLLSGVLSNQGVYLSEVEGANLVV